MNKQQAEDLHFKELVKEQAKPCYKCGVKDLVYEPHEDDCEDAIELANIKEHPTEKILSNPECECCTCHEDRICYHPCCINKPKCHCKEKACDRCFLFCKPKEDWEWLLERDVFGRHSSLYSYSKKETLEKTKSFIRELLQKERELIIKQLIIIRDVEMEGKKDLLETRAGYNVNLLIDKLSNIEADKEVK